MTIHKYGISLKVLHYSTKHWRDLLHLRDHTTTEPDIKLKAVKLAETVHKCSSVARPLCTVLGSNSQYCINQACQPTSVTWYLWGDRIRGRRIIHHPWLHLEYKSNRGHMKLSQNKNLVVEAVMKSTVTQVLHRRTNRFLPLD